MSDPAGGPPPSAEAAARDGSVGRSRVPAVLRRLSPAEWVLAGLVLAGTVLRAIAMASYWPVVTNMSDSIVYSEYARNDVVGNPQHPAGYSMFLAILGFITHQVAVVTTLQHLFGIATALLMYFAVRRLTRSQWAGLIPAAVVLLNSDQIFLEQNVMSEALCELLLAGALYCAVRALDDRDPWWRWPLAAGALTAFTAIVRTETIFLIPVMFLALLLVRRRPWRKNLAAPGAMLGMAAVILLGYAVTNQIANGRFEVGPSTGWHLYGRVAPFADCTQFTPPAGTEALCHPELPPPDTRVGSDWYVYLPESPAVKTFGHMGEDDSKLKEFALQVIEHQPRAYLTAVFDDIKTFFVPETRVSPAPYEDSDLSTELDWSREVEEPTLGEIRGGMETFFDPFTVHERKGGVDFLQGYEHPFRFGATLLSLCSLLVLLGLFVGDRRSRIGVFLFGVGGLAMLTLSMFGGWYVGRYTVPIAGTVAAGAAIALCSLWRMERDRRRANAAAIAAAQV